MNILYLKIFFLIIITSLYDCRGPFMVFETAQPFWVPDEDSLDVSLHGTYNKLNDPTSTLFIAGNVIYETNTFNLKESKADLRKYDDIVISNDTIYYNRIFDLNKQNIYVFKYKVDNDSLSININFTDTIFALNYGCKVKFYDGHYYINQPYNIWWRTKRFTISNDTLLYEKLDWKKAYDNTKESLVHYIFSSDSLYKNVIIASDSQIGYEYINKSCYFISDKYIRKNN